jgi:hypothetical protein
VRAKCLRAGKCFRDHALTGISEAVDDVVQVPSQRFRVSCDS